MPNAPRAELEGGKRFAVQLRLLSDNGSDVPAPVWAGTASDGLNGPVSR